MPDRRGHGADEDRGPGGAGEETWHVAARPAGGASAALRALCGYLAPLLNLRNGSRRSQGCTEKITGFSARRSLPIWRRERFTPPVGALGRADGPEVVLWADTFNAAFEPENIHAAIAISQAPDTTCMSRGRRAGAPALLRPHLSLGWRCRAAKAEMARTLAVLKPFVMSGIPVLGLEPSCLFPSATRLSRCSPARRRKRWRRRPCWWRNSSPAKSRPAASRRAWRRWRSGPCCTAIATRRPSAR